MTPTRILVIDTDPAVRAVVRDVLTAAMLCEVVEAADAFTVNAELQRQQPDLVVVDAQLPDLSEVCWVVKQLRVVSGEIPVLAITLAEFAEVPDPVLAGVGVQRTLPKAFTADSLLAAVHDLLNLETPPPIDLTWPEVGDPADAGSLGRVGKPGKRVLVVEDDVTTLAFEERQGLLHAEHRPEDVGIDELAQVPLQETRGLLERRAGGVEHEDV